jgi:voltage-gated potassium channel
MTKRVKLLLWVAAVSFLVSAIPFWFFERVPGSTARYGILDVIWWWVVTATTLGYGDIVPHTPGMKLVACFTILTGFFIYTNAVTMIAESMHAYLERRSRGTARIHARGHIVICEYTAVADELIQSLPEARGFSDKDVVIVSDLVNQNPYPQHHFVSGVPINPAALRQANVQEAEAVFIFANLRFADPDVKTVHVASRVLALNPDVRIFVELVDPRNELLQYAPHGLIVMESRRLMESVLRDKHIDPNDWLDAPKTIHEKLERS